MQALDSQQEPKRAQIDFVNQQTAYVNTNIAAGGNGRNELQSTIHHGETRRPRAPLAAAGSRRALERPSRPLQLAALDRTRDSDALVPSDLCRPLLKICGRPLCRFAGDHSQMCDQPLAICWRPLLQICGRPLLSHRTGAFAQRTFAAQQSAALAKGAARHPAKA